MQNSRAVSTSARVIIACDQAPMAPMAISEISVATPMPAGNLPGDQREQDNRHRRRHAQQQLLEAAEDVIHRDADPLEHRTEVQ
jgi:membrane-bound ClpP family serine protease